MRGQAAPPIRVLAVRPTPALAAPATRDPVVHLTRVPVDVQMHDLEALSMPGRAELQTRVRGGPPTLDPADRATLAPAARAIRAQEEGGDVPAFAADQLRA